MKKANALHIIFDIYLLAIGAAVVTAFFLKDSIDNVILVLLIADVAATLVVFFASIPLRNASVYDPYWSVAPPCLIAGYYLLTGASFMWVHLWVIAPLCLWAIRLTYNWTLGFTDLKWQDWRYTDFKNKFPKAFLLISFSGIMMMPTLLVFAGMIPFYYFLTGGTSTIIAAISGLIIFLATVYQATADRQKRIFLKNPRNKGKVMDTGLWGLSRHPNYFGEIMIWWGMFYCAVGNFSWPAVLGAPLITLMFIFISVPLMTKHMASSRPTTFPKYKARVKSPLIPIPPIKAR